MKPAIATLQKVYHSNSDLTLSEFRKIVETSGYRLTGRWDREKNCPEIVADRPAQSLPAAGTFFGPIV